MILLISHDALPASGLATIYLMDDELTISGPKEHRDALKNHMKRYDREKKEAFVKVSVLTEDDVLFAYPGSKPLAHLAGQVFKALQDLGVSTGVIHAPHLVSEEAERFFEGLGLADYRFDRYRSEKKEARDLNLCLEGATAPVDAAAFGLSLAEATNLTRDLVNTPANDLYPEDLAAACDTLFSDLPVEVTVHEEGAIRAFGMTAYLEVARGSVHAPRLILLRYEGAPDQPEELTAFIGKGLTYDSGGYSIKSKEGMLDMKSDMGGSAAVIGALRLIAERALPVNIVGVIAACENMISGGSYHPGDIIGSMGGKSIYIKSTDAEGRLTLADALTFSQRELKAKRLVDIATLTGGQVVALGQERIGSQSNDDTFHALLDRASERSGEKIWRMPHDDAYGDLIKHHEADLTNAAREASMVTAGMFLMNFVEDRPWIHLDIAGPAFTDKATPTGPKGATGAGVRLLYRLAEELV